MYAAIILMPWLLTLILTGVILKSNLMKYHPAWSDEVIYWQEIATFKEVGFKGGYFSIGENVAASPFSHFGTHGPVFPVLYGSMGRILGWTRTSGPVINLIVVSLALMILLLLNKPGKIQSIFILLTLVFAYPLLLYLPTTMQEGLIQAFAIVLAVFIIRLSSSKPAGLALKIFAAAVLTAACLLKITFVLAAFPIFFLLRSKRSTGWFILSSVTAVLFCLGMYGIFTYWTGPSPDWMFHDLAAAHAPLNEVVTTVLKYAGKNLGNYLSLSGTNQTIETVFNYQYLAMIIICAVLLRKQKTLLVSTLFVLASTLVITILFYDVRWFCGYRTLAPFLLMAMLVLAFCVERIPVRGLYLVFLITNLLAAGVFLRTYREIHPDQFADEWDPEMKVYSAGFSQLRYDPDADAWCNSIAGISPSGENIGSIQPGLGINLLFDYPGHIERIRSHYLFMPVEYLKDFGLADSCQVIQEAEGNVICERTDDGCS